ncbi:MAG: VCBS repeat-containing protein, partial [Verrucomicrobia bacterium]|nr:VCBS repeat-containing protein [Verrucomicrobiota bacterium]
MRFLASLLIAASAAAAEVSFDKQTITKDFVAEGCAVADFNHDGNMDIAAGRYIWLGPDFKEKIAYTPERNNPTGPNKTPYTPDTGYSDYFIQFAYDFNGDGWQDILVYGLPGDPAYVFENPQAKGGDWTRHNIFDVADGESPDLVDINGDGKPELLCHSSDLVKPTKAKGGKSGGQFGYVEIDWKNPFAKGRFRPITPKTPENDIKIFKYTHGYGAGDVNGDGRVDILEKDGWYEQPTDTSKDSNWKF